MASVWVLYGEKVGSERLSVVAAKGETTSAGWGCSVKFSVTVGGADEWAGRVVVCVHQCAVFRKVIQIGITKDCEKSMNIVS